MFQHIGNFTIAGHHLWVSDEWVFPNGEDHGAQYFSANPTWDTGGYWLCMSHQRKTRHHDGTVSYGFSVYYTAPTPAEDPTGFQWQVSFDVEGGGLGFGWNGVGTFTIPPKQTWTIDIGWGGPEGQPGPDHGFQYCSANPKTDPRNPEVDFTLVMSNQSKTRYPDGSVSYSVDVFNPSEDYSVTFDMQGGGSSVGFNAADSGSIGPGDPKPISGKFGDGRDFAAQYISGNPTSRAGSTLVMSNEAKARDFYGKVSYGCDIQNTDSDFPVFYDIQGGGFS